MYRQVVLFFVAGCLLGFVTCQGPGAGDGGAGGGGGFIFNFASAIYLCGDAESLKAFNTSTLEVQSINDTHSTISGPMGIKISLPVKFFLIEVIVTKESNGKQEIVLTLTICDLCDELHEGSEHWKYIKFFGLPPACPFPPGIYDILHFLIYPDDLPLKAPSVGSYIVTIIISENVSGDCDDTSGKKFIACLKIEFSVESS